MNKKFHVAPMTAVFLVFLLVLPTAVQARMEKGLSWGVPTDNGPVYAMMGGNGGMMGGGGGGSGTMGSGGGISAILEDLSARLGDWNRDRDRETQHREELRQRIHEKRKELASLFRSDTPDKKLIDQKIAELNRLEAELDLETDGSNNSR